MKKENWFSRYSIGYSVILALVIAILIFIANWNFGFSKVVEYPRIVSLGELGDIFGISSALFSAFAFILLAYGLALQRKEMKTVVEQLRVSQSLADAQKEALDKQNRAQERQVFEATFFKMLEISKMTLDKIASSKGSPSGDVSQLEGISALISLLVIFTYAEDKPDNVGQHRVRMEANRIEFTKKLEELRTPIDIRFSHHMKQIARTLRYANNSEQPDKDNFVDIVLNTLTNPELLILAHFVEIHNEFSDIKEIIIKRKALKLLNLDDFRSRALLFAYPREAFELEAIPEEYYADTDWS